MKAAAARWLWSSSKLDSLDRQLATLDRAISARGSRAESRYRSTTRSGLIALLHRLGMEHREPTAISRKLDPAKQAAFIKQYEDQLDPPFHHEAVIFPMQCLPPTRCGRFRCWAPKQVPIAVPTDSDQDRLNIHGAIDAQPARPS